MNKTVSAPSLGTSEPLKTGSPELEALLNQIAEGASDRERDRVLPFEVIDLIRRARLGALRLPLDAGGAGSTIRDLFAFVIRLGEADANVAHILRNHFSVVERLVRTPQGRAEPAMAEGGRRGRHHRTCDDRARKPARRQRHARARRSRPTATAIIC